MLRIECDNPELTKALARLGTDVGRCGGLFSDDLVLRAMDGDLSFTSSISGSKPEFLMSIPEKAFIPYEGVEFKLEGNNLVLASGAEKLTPEVRERLETMVSIYNLTSKIEKYKESSPRVAFMNDPEFLKRLAAGRAGTKIAENTLEILTTEDKEKVIVSSFLKTRNFNFGDGQKKIIPFIDFTNHHTLARPFDRGKDSDGNFVMKLNNSKPIEGEDQCFAQYGKWDSHDTYLMFGFSTETSAFVRSVPMEIQIEGLGKIKVNSNIAGRFRGKLPPEMVDLTNFFPPLWKITSEEVEVATLLIPNLERPIALKRIFARLISLMAPDLDTEVLQRHIASAEFQVLSKNLEHYNSLIKLFEEKKEQYKSTPAFREAVKMVKIQIREIEKYQDYFINFATKVEGTA
ncbi:MAG: hypothetical protein V3R64_03300 [Sphingomonadales bacterium]